MTDETIPKYGQPISLDRPDLNLSEEEQKARELVAKQAIIANAKIGLGKVDSSPTISDTDLARQIEQERLLSTNNRLKLPLEQTENTLKSLREQISKRSALDKFWQPFESFFGMENLEEKKQNIELRKKEFLAEINAQKEKIHFLEENVISRPEILNRIIEQAYDESQIVQRMALGVAISEAAGSSNLIREFPKETLQQYVDMYNQGKLQIEDRHYEKALAAYESATQFLRAQLFHNPPLPSTPKEIAHDYFDPSKQINYGILK
jgi:hypothetical protein